MKVGSIQAHMAKAFVNDMTILSKKTLCRIDKLGRELRSSSIITCSMVTMQLPLGSFVGELREFDQNDNELCKGR